jgi:hypothetical protein
MRQPWLFANSCSSSSGMSRKTRNSADWVTTYSELFESLSPILAARAGKSLCIATDQPCESPRRSFSCGAAMAAALIYGSAWPRVRGQLCGRAKGHATLVSPYGLALVEAFVPNAYVSNSSLGTSAATTVSVHWRGPFPSLTSVDVFGDHRVTRSHH